MNAEYESWAETLDTLSDPEEMEAIREGAADIRAGNVVSFEEVFGKPLGNAVGTKNRRCTELPIHPLGSK